MKPDYEALYKSLMEDLEKLVIEWTNQNPTSEASEIAIERDRLTRQLFKLLECYPSRHE